MSKTLPPQSNPVDQAWRSGDILETESHKKDRFLGWWYALTAVPEPPANASFVKREAARRARLFSAVSFFILIILLLLAPGSIMEPNRIIIYLDAVLISATLFTLFLNHSGRSLLASVLLIIIGEIGLSTIILTTLPLTEINIQMYYLYVVIDVVAVSLLPPQFVFILVACNSLFIGLDMMYQPHTAVLNHDLVAQAQFVPILAQVIGVQILVAGVAYLWVRSSARAIQRADRAEMIAKLEHTIAEERALSEQARVALEKSIEQLVQAHTEAMNRQAIPKISYPQEAKVLWPLVGVMNSLWTRLQRTHQTEQELQQLKQTIAAYTDLVQKAAFAPQQPLPLYQTKSDLDPLLLAVDKLQRVLRERR